MKKIIIYLFLLSNILLQGCIAPPSNTRRNSLSTSSSTSTKNNNSSTAINYPSFAIDDDLYWFTSIKVLGTITLNKNSQDIVYLRGKSIHDFLISKDATGIEYYRKQYCIVGNFPIPATYKQLRVRAIPIYVTTSTKAVERLLRIDFPNDTDNTSACQNTTIDSIAAINASFSFPKICLTCSGQITSNNLNLYEIKNLPSLLAKVDTTKLTLSLASIRVDLQSNATDPNSICTNASCGAKGFDCCIQGQCVIDSSEKINASSDPQYAQSKIDFATNPLSFINYPNIYYICTNIAHPPFPPNTPTTTPVSEAQSRVTKYKDDYICITEAVATTPSYLNCKSTILNDNKKEAAYTAIKKKLAISCGCTAIDSEMAVKCPDWGILPIYLPGTLQIPANITDFICYTPQPANPSGPIINLNIGVPNRSAPHRFYSSTGISYDSLNGLQLKSPSIGQEGDDFFYLDEYNKVGPINGSFNINSILGKMTVDLSHTTPAKEVDVEVGKSYIISATSGYFTPCSQCAKDNWFQTFSAHPSSQRGVGLQAFGFSTSRDSFSGNTTFGNYEDTKFGRACFLPVTMIPLSHQKNINLQTQRQNRLKTQSAFYINGYQRDWFGFNQGALIGSFDGVVWFAVGTGRRVTATSNKLFLAINAAFLDLADKSDTMVNIIPNFSANTAADYDYDPDIAIIDPRQNSAGTCQQFHQCSVDAECVAQLGWEYVCSDVSQIKSKWPLFDSNALELTNQERILSIFELLQYTISTSSNKRCVYRGAGAPCKRNYSTLNEFTKKNFTCAPNFYCASITSNKFNNELVRSINEFDDILFGMDTNVLGRPVDYVTASKSLNSEIASNIKSNAKDALNLTDLESNDMGICRPGRLLSDDPIKAHSSPDAAKRADYISQIGSCNSEALSIATSLPDVILTRYESCPVFGDDLNYILTTRSSDKIHRQETQNSCGGETRNTSTNLSAFQNSIDGKSLINSQNISQPVIPINACLRRAGSICNSDLDCGPNKLHEEATGSLPLSYFGETDAEQQYWKESLVCGQEKLLPILGTMDYFNYKLSDNRCCREIGKDFTMYTEGPKTIVPDNTGTNEKLITKQFPSYKTNALYRYSRYTNSTNGRTVPSKIPKVTETAEPTSNQWQVLNETGSLTCCGGGWVRKFADGTHDWKVRNRLSIDTNNFSCLNFRSPLADSDYNNFINDLIVQASYQREYELFCKSPDKGGCIQIPYQKTEGFIITSPLPYYGSNGDSTSRYAILDTSPTDSGDPYSQNLNNDAPYIPTPYTYTPFPRDINTTTGKSYTYFENKLFDYGVEFYLPAYIGWDHSLGNTTTFIKKVWIKYFYENPFYTEIVEATVASDENACIKVIDDPQLIPVEDILINTYCIVQTDKTQNRPVFIARANSNAAPVSWARAGIIIEFYPIEQARQTKVVVPGNPLYYLSKLGRLELNGIPQITYEPIYCNNNQDNLVSGIFKSSIQTRTQFINSSIAYNGLDPIKRYGSDNVPDASVGYGNIEKHFTFQNNLEASPIFSSKDFTCCTPLGKIATSPANCCSNHAVVSPDGKTLICKLPKGSDLNVYFNKFVSGEGTNEGELSIVGTDTDFNDYTGEPKLRDATFIKLVNLGNNYCDGRVEFGGAFGAFQPEPFSGVSSKSYPESIVDSFLDQATNTNLGKVPFDNGYKWNHHLYCK